jgi:hypothetical protein
MEFLAFIAPILVSIGVLLLAIDGIRAREAFNALVRRVDVLEVELAQMAAKRPENG